MNYMDGSVQIEERWWKAGEAQKEWPRDFLMERESTCITACDRFLNADFIRDSIWLLSRGGLSASALLLQSKRTLFPVFGNVTEIPVPAFLKRFLVSVPVHAVQGLAKDVSAVENVISPLGYETKHRSELFLMSYEGAPYRAPPPPIAYPSGLVIRFAKKSDYTGLLELQIDYEIEEVTTDAKNYKPESAMVSLNHILERETCLVAEYKGKLVGKINTNAHSFTRKQLGGVYVKPSYRQMGIASAMVGAMKEKLCSGQYALSLFVRKSNIAAIKVYSRAGFKTVADYRISYMN